MDTGHLISIVGIALNVLSLVGGGLYALAKVDSRLEVLNNAHSSFVSRLDKVDNKLNSLNDVVVQIAKQEARLDAMDQRMQAISDRLSEYASRIENYALPKVRKRN